MLLEAVFICGELGELKPDLTTIAHFAIQLSYPMSNLQHSLRSRVVEGVIDLPQPLGEDIRADELSMLAGELDYSVFFDRMSISEGRREADTRICRYTL